MLEGGKPSLQSVPEPEEGDYAPSPVEKWSGSPSCLQGLCEPAAIYLTCRRNDEGNGKKAREKLHPR